MSSTTRPQAPAVGPALLVGCAAVIGFVVLLQVALWSVWGQRADHEAVLTVVAGREARLTALSILGRVSVWSLAALAIGCLLTAALRRHGRAAIAAVLVLCGANATTQTLKHVLLDRPDFGLGVHNSLPSGHVTVVAASVAALLLVSAPAARSVIAAVGAFAIALTGLSTIVAGWHRPSDVVAALLVCLGWCALGVLVHGGQRIRPGTAALSAVTGAAAALVAIALIGVRPAAGIAGFVDAALVLGAAALASAVAVAVMVWLSPTDG